MDAEDSRDHSGTDPGGTDPVSTVAHQNGSPNNVCTLLKRNTYHAPASASNKESSCGAMVLGATIASVMDMEDSEYPGGTDHSGNVAHQDGSPINTRLVLKRNTYHVSKKDVV